MELRDYVRMLRQGWRVIAVVTAICIAVAGTYVAFAPREYGATTVLFVSANSPSSIDDLQQGNTFAATAVITYAQIINSATVLGPAAASLRPQRSIEDLQGSVSSTVREETTLVDIAVTAGSPSEASDIANAVATTAVRVLPGLQTSPEGRPLVRLQQIRPAVPPFEPSAPNIPRILLISLLIGVLVGAAGTVVKQSMDTRIRRREDVTAISSLPIVAVLPGLKGTSADGLASRDAPTSAASDGFRHLRTSLNPLLARNSRTFLFTSSSSDSALPAQIAANLAWSMAQVGRRVLLVDGDMRSPRLGSVFGLSEKYGLADAIASPERTPLCSPTIDPFLSVMVSGSPTTSPADVLSSPSMPKLLSRFLSEYDAVVIVLPPVLDHADCAIVASTAGETFLCIEAGVSKSTELRAALDTLANVQIRPMGLVLVGASRNERFPATGGPTPLPNAVLTEEVPLRPLEPRPTPRARQRYSNGT